MDARRRRTRPAARCAAGTAHRPQRRLVRHRPARAAWIEARSAYRLHRRPRRRSGRAALARLVALDGQAEIEIEELDALAGAAAIDIERQEALLEVGPIAEEQVADARGCTHANRQLTERIHLGLTGGTFHQLLLVGDRAISAATGVAPSTSLAGSRLRPSSSPGR